jgi:hypothetical protein
MAHFVNELDNHQLQNVTERVDLINTTAQVVQRAILISMDEHHESVTLA